MMWLIIIVVLVVVAAVAGVGIWLATKSPAPAVTPPAATPPSAETPSPPAETPQEQVASVGDGQTLTLTPPTGKKVNIVSATYGNPGKGESPYSGNVVCGSGGGTSDVTDKVKSLVSADGSLSITNSVGITNLLAALGNIPDPCAGVPKILLIRYTYV